MEENGFVKAISSMGFADMDGEGTFMRFEGNGIVFAMDVDIDGDECIYGIKMIEAYGQDGHERVIAYERYIENEEDVVLFLKHCNAEPFREKEDYKKTSLKLQRDLYDVTRDRNELQEMRDKELKIVEELMDKETFDLYIKRVVGI